MREHRKPKTHRGKEQAKLYWAVENGLIHGSLESRNVLYHLHLRMHKMLTVFAVADDQLQDIISASDAWQIADDDSQDGPTTVSSINSARRVKGLVEQVAGTALLIRYTFFN